MQKPIDFLTLRILPCILIVAVLSLSGCFKATVTPMGKRVLEEPTKVPPDKIFAVKTPAGIVALENFQVDQQGILSGEYRKIEQETQEEVTELLEEDKTNISGNWKEVESLIVIEAAGVVFMDDKNIAVDLAEVSAVKSIDKNVGASVGSSIITGVLTIIGLLALIGVIVALTKSSCPLIYSYDEEGGKHFEGEVFGGSIFPQLERTDHLPLSNLMADSTGQLKVQVANKLKEKQFINDLHVYAAPVDSQYPVFWDKSGQPFSRAQAQPALQAQDATGAGKEQLLAQEDSLYYNFAETAEDSVLSHLDVRFSGRLDSATHLLLKVKNSLWFDQLWMEYTEHFGHYYQEWYEDEKAHKSRAEMRQWQYEQGIPLRLFAKVEGEWLLQDTLQCPGPLAWRQMAIALKNPEAREFRLQGGLLFWEIDHLQLVRGKAVAKIEVPFSRVRTQSGEEVREKLQAKDQHYLEQAPVNDWLELRAFPPGQGSYSYLLEATGHYEHIRNFENNPDFLKLLEFRQKQSFAKYSQERQAEIKNHLQYANL